jgi:hypothetical protein
MPTAQTNAACTNACAYAARCLPGAVHRLRRNGQHMGEVSQTHLAAPFGHATTPPSVHDAGELKGNEEVSHDVWRRQPLRVHPRGLSERHELDAELEHRVGWYLLPRPLGTVAERAWNDNFPLVTRPHQLQRFVPTRDHTVGRECRRCPLMALWVAVQWWELQLFDFS